MEKAKCTLYGGHSRPYKNVRFGYFIHSPMKQQKSTFNYYNLFPDIILIQGMVGKCDVNYTYYAFSTTKMIAQ